MRLLIFKVNQLGDNIAFLPAAQALERLLPAAEITVVTSPLAAPLYRRAAPRLRVIEEPTPPFNKAWSNPAALLRLHRQTRATQPDACLLPPDQGSTAHLLAWMSGAPLRLGSITSRCRLRSLLTRAVPLHPADIVAHQNWRLLLALLDALEVPHSDLPETPPAPLLGPSTVGDSMQKPHRSIVIHPGASRDYQRWPAARFIELASRLADHAPLRFVAQGLEAETRLDPRVELARTPSLDDLIALIAKARLFIGNNSGPMHLASALGVPGLIFAGPAAPSWRPAWNAESFTLLRDPALACQPCDRDDGPANHCGNAREPLACLTRLSVERALVAALELLARF